MNDLPAVSTATEPTQQQYEFRCISIQYEGSRGFLIEGSVINLSASSWGHDHRIGLRNFKTATGEVIPEAESRGQTLNKSIGPGGSMVFYVSLRGDELPSGAASFELDVVHEGVAWLSNHGSVPLTVNLIYDGSRDTRQHWFNCLLSIQDALSPSKRMKGQLLRQVLLKFDFTGYGPVAQTRNLLRALEEGQPYRHPKPSSMALSREFGKRSDLFFTHYATISGQNSSQSEKMERFASLLKLWQSLQDYYYGTYPPIPHALVAWLNARALPQAIAKTLATRSMVAFLEDGQPFFVNNNEQTPELIWWFATRILIDKQLPVTLIPEVVKQSLAMVITNFPPGPFPELPEFMLRLHRDDANYAARYELSDPVDRCAFTFDLLILSLENEARRELLGSEVMEWFNKPSGLVSDATPLEILLMANSGKLPPEAGAANTDGIRLSAQFDWLPRRQQTSTYAARVVGLLNSQSGLGVNARMSRRALEVAGLLTEAVDLSSQTVCGPGVDDTLLQALTRPLDIYHLNLDDTPRAICRFTSPGRQDALRVCFALWETSTMPEQHRVGADIVDEIWAPSTYVADVYRAAGYNNVHVVGKGIELPDTEDIDLTRFGIKPGCFTFMLSFDVGSWIERKNPMAAVDAFRAAFTHQPDVRLLIKSNGLYDHPGDRSRQIERIAKAAESDERIVLVSETMPFAAYLGLIRSVDATISPHRSEGFGYLAAYSLLLNTPALVTDYSGTTDFCSDCTAFPVSFKLKQLAPADFVYHAPGAVWADIDLEHLIHQMQFVVSDRAEAEKRTAAGAELVKSRYSMPRLASTYLGRMRQMQVL